MVITTTFGWSPRLCYNQDCVSEELGLVSKPLADLGKKELEYKGRLCGLKNTSF